MLAIVVFSVLRLNINSLFLQHRAFQHKIALWESEKIEFVWKTAILLKANDKKFSLFIHFIEFKKWCCHTNMLVIETISHSMHFFWRVHAGHFISFTWFLKPRRMSKWMDKNNSREVSESWILPLSSVCKYLHLLIFEEPLYIHLILPAVLCPQLMLLYTTSLCPFSHLPPSAVRLHQNFIKIAEVTHHLFVTKPNGKISVFIYLPNICRTPVVLWALF